MSHAERMDLVDQLRGRANGDQVPFGLFTLERAADEIEALRKEVANKKENKAQQLRIRALEIERDFYRAELEEVVTRASAALLYNE